MTVEEMIRTAAKPTCGEVYPNIYTGSQTEYATFNYSELGAIFAGGRAHALIYSVQLHWFLPRKKNPRAGKAAIREALHEAGCTWPDIIDASDGTGQHYVFEFQWSEGIED